MRLQEGGTQGVLDGSLRIVSLGLQEVPEWSHEVLERFHEIF